MSTENTYLTLDMPIEEAREITAACQENFMNTMGLLEDRLPKPVQQYTLDEMLAANAIVAADKGVESERIDENGKVVRTRSRQMFCAPRLVAALYVAAQFKGADLRYEKGEPIAIAHGNIVLSVRADSVTYEEDDS